MKLTTLIASSVVFFASLSAQAVLLAPGTFIPAQCGAQTQVQIVGGNVGEVCLGSVVGEETPAIEFRMMGEESRIFRIVNESTAGIGKNNGKVLSVMTIVSDEGQQEEMKVLQTEDGDITAVSGQLGDIGYVVTEFATIFSIQSL
ncbi:MAG: hypothetical protein V4692_09230 [Bdellovibrionota bacterium]